MLDVGVASYIMKDVGALVKLLPKDKALKAARETIP